MSYVTNKKNRNRQMKHYTLIFLVLIIVSCKQEKDQFTLNVKIEGQYPDSLFLNYGDKKEGLLIENGRGTFYGNVESILGARFNTNKFSSLTDDFYLENNIINVNLLSEFKVIKGTEIYMLSLAKVEGSRADLIRQEHEVFQKKHHLDKNWKTLLYNKIAELIKTKQKHPYGFDLLNGAVSQSALGISELRTLYALIDKNLLSIGEKNKIEYKIFPKKRIVVGDSILDFELNDVSGAPISTKDYRGSILLIDFWASWCKPCRKQVPEMIELADKYKTRKFNILGVSLDKNKEKWLNAVKEDKLVWDNVIDTIGGKGKVALDYGIVSIPSYVIINEKGVVVAKDLNIEELKVKLEEVFDKE